MRDFFGELCKDTWVKIRVIDTDALSYVTSNLSSEKRRKKGNIYHKGHLENVQSVTILMCKIR